jgi:hypothetical protein
VLVELLVPNLLENVRIPGFVDLECFAAMGADDLVQNTTPYLFIRVYTISDRAIHPNNIESALSIMGFGWRFGIILPVHSKISVVCRTRFPVRF